MRQIYPVTFWCATLVAVVHAVDLPLGQFCADPQQTGMGMYDICVNTNTQGNITCGSAQTVPASVIYSGSGSNPQMPASTILECQKDPQKRIHQEWCCDQGTAQAKCISTADVSKCGSNSYGWECFVGATTDGRGSALCLQWYGGSGRSHYTFVGFPVPGWAPPACPPSSTPSSGSQSTRSSSNANPTSSSSSPSDSSNSSSSSSSSSSDPAQTAKIVGAVLGVLAALIGVVAAWYNLKRRKTQAQTAKLEASQAQGGQRQWQPQSPTVQGHYQAPAQPAFHHQSFQAPQSPYRHLSYN
ncbi:hypothetical protein HDV00_010735 [Rhizophlyctis rosea]|nr:hypothetical protein HDV00_010735 [Rhizophlyctis rosea]